MLLGCKAGLMKTVDMFSHFYNLSPLNSTKRYVEHMNAVSFRTIVDQPDIIPSLIQLIRLTEWNQLTQVNQLNKLSKLNKLNQLNLSLFSWFNWTKTLANPGADALEMLLSELALHMRH